jgi:hypothetical protein
VHPAI